MYKGLVSFIRKMYATKEFIPLHEPRFSYREKEYLLDVIDTGYVSSVGKCVNEFEKLVAEYVGVSYAVATVNGTSALHAALKVSGVRPEDEVITQSLTFVATCNAIHYCNAYPVFVDVNKTTLGLSPRSLEEFLHKFCEIREDGFCWNKSSGRIIRACVPMNTFGFPVQIDEIERVCNKFNIILIEDAAESLGSYYKQNHTGSTSKLAILSFNGNKIITTGGGGMILTNDKELAYKARYITTTAKVKNQWVIEHDEIGYNYRMPNLNAALGIAQMEALPGFVDEKRIIAAKYQAWGNKNGIEFFHEPSESTANYWLNTVITKDKNQRDLMLKQTNNNNVMTRPVWTPMHQLSIYEHYQKGELKNTEWLCDRLVNVPSSVPINRMSNRYS